jgi:hypothetical protein
VSEKHRQSPGHKQVELLNDAQTFKLSIEAKLNGLARGPQWLNFQKCGEEEIYRTCKGCHSVEKFYYNCNLKWCPRCNWRITKARIEKIKAWMFFTKQCKHVVLTQRNSQFITRKRIRAFQAALVRLRRTKLMKGLKGGVASIEITNEQKGWHLHAHLLLDIRWIDKQALSEEWGRQVGQDFAIVDISDARDGDYAKQVSKYVCMGSEMAKWPAHQIWEFICAIKGIRFFTAFGSINKHRDEIKAMLDAARPAPTACACGCHLFKFETDEQSIINEIRRSARRH